MKLESSKIALCLSGQPRYVSIGYEYIKKHLLDKYDVDVFVHTWFDVENVNKQFEFSPHLMYNRTGKLEENVIETITNLYHPKKIEVSQSIKFETFDVDYGLCLPNSVHSMFYSIYKSNSLKKQYESVNDFKYDVVIRCRFDVIIDNFLLEDINDDEYYVSGEIHRSGQFNVPNDQFCLSSSENMDLYSDLYNSLLKYKESGFKLFVGEHLLKHHIVEANNKKFNFCDGLLSINIVKNR